MTNENEEVVNELLPCPIKVMQTKFGKDRGNCLAACMSTLTGIDIDKFPPFYSYSGIEWWDALYSWCVENNYGLMLVKKNDQDKMLVLNQYGIGVAKLKNIEERHAVILKYTLTTKTDKWFWDAEVWHDPNPKKYEIEEIEEHIFINNLNTRKTTAPEQGLAKLDEYSLMPVIRDEILNEYKDEHELSANIAKRICSKFGQPVSKVRELTGLSILKGCGICGGATILIRGKYPKEDNRKVCPTCLQERLEQINEISSREYGQCSTYGTAEDGNESNSRICRR